MNKLLMAMSISFIGHVIAWFHMQGQFKYEWAKSLWWVVLGGIPISLCFVAIVSSTILMYLGSNILSGSLLLGNNNAPGRGNRGIF